MAQAAPVTAEPVSRFDLRDGKIAADFETMRCSEALEAAVEFHRQGKIGEAKHRYRAILEAEPNSADVLNLLGLVHATPAESFQAILLLQRAARLAPGYAEVHTNLGVAFGVAQRWEEAAGSYERALSLQPGFPAARRNLEAMLDKLLAPRDANACFLTGQALLHLQRIPEALELLRSACQLSPAAAETYETLGGAYFRSDGLEESIEAYQRALRLNPRSALTHYNLGFVHQAQNRLPAAVRCFEKALALDAGCATARLQLGMVQLLAKDFAAGWRNYEARWEIEPAKSARRPAGRRWEGESAISGRTIVLYAEQGLGDTLQFVRFAPAVMARGAAVMLEVQRPLLGLIRHSFPSFRVVAAGEEATDCEFSCPLMSLPLVLGRNFLEPDGSGPYLQVPPARPIATAEEKLRSSSGLRVGLAWAGNPQNRNDRKRSLPLAGLKELLSVPNCTFYSLQKEIPEGDAPAEWDSRLENLAPFLTDFAATGALLQSLDLLITVDTAVAHLAGALGKPLWILLPFAPDWRWGFTGQTTPWYPSARLFRQTKKGDWPGVMRSVAAELLQLAAAANTGPR